MDPPASSESTSASASASSSSAGAARVPISQRLSSVVKQAIEMPPAPLSAPLSPPPPASASTVPAPAPAPAPIDPAATSNSDGIANDHVPTADVDALTADRAVAREETSTTITPELVNDLRVQLEQSNLRESQLQRAVHALEEELGRAQSHAVAFENAMAEMTKLRERMEHMSTQLRHEEERNHEMEASRRAIDAEYESLSVSLFDQANNMVKEQSMLRAHAERRAFMAETRLRDAEGVVESLRIELAGLKRLLEEEAVVGDAHSEEITAEPSSGAAGAPGAPPVAAAPTVVRPPPNNNTAGEEWQSDTLPITLVAPTPSMTTDTLTIPASPQPGPTSSSRRGSSALPYLPQLTDTATPTLHPYLALEFHTFLTVLFAPTGPRTNYLTPADRENALYRTKFMERLFEEDVKPSLALPALSWLQKKSLAGAVSSNALAILPRRAPFLVKRKPKGAAGTTAGSAALRSAAKSFLPALQSLGSAGVVAGFAVPGGPLVPPSGYSSPSAGSPTTGTSTLFAAADSLPTADVADQEPLEYAPDTCECWGCGTPVVNLAPLTVVALSDTDTPRPVCKLCRGKLVAVCQLFAYLRRLAAGIVPKTRLMGGAGHVRSGSAEAGAAAAEQAARPRQGTAEEAARQEQGQQDKYSTAASALFQRFSTVTASLSSRYGAHSPTPPSATSAESAAAATANGTGAGSPGHGGGGGDASPSTPSSTTLSTSFSALGASFFGNAGGLSSSSPSAAAAPRDHSPGGRSSPNPPPHQPATAPVDLEPTVPLTPEFVGALWSDLCRLRQRMFLARLAIPLPGNADLFEGHQVVERAVQARDAAAGSAPAPAPAAASVASPVAVSEGGGGIDQEEKRAAHDLDSVQTSRGRREKDKAGGKEEQQAEAQQQGSTEREREQANIHVQAG